MYQHLLVPIDGSALSAANVLSAVDLAQGLAAQLADGSVKDIRGQGLMLGIELSKPCGALMQQAMDKGLLISVTADSVVRLGPSLILTEAEASDIAAILCPLICQFLAD